MNAVRRNAWASAVVMAGLVPAIHAPGSQNERDGFVPTNGSTAERGCPGHARA
jgi:hypothetical protein